jgi:hypothetical protein
LGKSQRLNPIHSEMALEQAWHCSLAQLDAMLSMAVATSRKPVHQGMKVELNE